jgi:hypothetical protein
MLRTRVSGLACAAIAAALLCAAPAHADVPQRGFVLTGSTAASYLSFDSDHKLQRMAGDGSNQAAVFTQWFMDGPTSSQIAPDPARTPTDDSILHAMGVAHAAGMAVTLKPQLGIRSGNWIGYAHPADLDVFWADYRTMLLHYADLAQQGGASMLVIGTEMATLSYDDARWRSLIAEVRTHFSGELTYAANYDEFQQVPFWDALDYIGIDAYFGLADDADPAPGTDALAGAWSDRGYLARIRAVSERVGRKVLFTEIGYRGTHGTAAHPNIWNGTQVTDTLAQASAYEAFYRTVSQQPWMAGFYWWEVNADSWWVQDYNPMGKQAEQVMIDWNKRLVPPPPPDPPAPTTEDPPADPQPPVAPPEPPALDTTPPVVDPPAPTVDSPPPAAEPTPPPTATPDAAPPVTTSGEPAPPVAPARIAATPPTVQLTLHGRRLSGAVLPYSPTCNGEASMRIRIASHGHWVLVQQPQQLQLTEAGRFKQALRGGRMRVRVLFTSRCGHAASPWLAVRG